MPGNLVIVAGLTGCKSSNVACISDAVGCPFIVMKDVAVPITYPFKSVLLAVDNLLSHGNVERESSNLAGREVESKSLIRGCRFYVLLNPFVGRDLNSALEFCTCKFS